MKELEEHKKDKPEIHNQREIKKELQKLGTYVLKPGQFLWKYDINTKEVTKAEVEKVAVTNTQLSIVKGKVIVQPGCLYCCAINKKNAYRKFIKQFKIMIDSHDAD